ncbi:MAG TPA: sigma-70 family RNA polymerase sigma factor [Thermoanaerobaculaceae bacterium]|nr:sigma-70 family RNA polymerase sigma factor [Thermoanaerobaculaceae bacterium]HPS76644.1 sigma-70 family RNA polymerase sigma factor [Thermoanaerobaculaceae bacterium]
MLTPPLDEAALTRALLAGDRHAANALIRLTYRRVFGLLVNLCRGDRELAADLTQETYRKAWEALPGFGGRAAFGTWLYRIAWNTFLAQARRPVRLVALEDPIAAVARDRSEPADDALVAAETTRRLRKAVGELPEELQAVVVARFWAGAPVGEIARLEGVSRVTVRSRIGRALGRLAGALKEVTS